MSGAELKDFEAEVACLNKPLVIMTIGLSKFGSGDGSKEKAFDIAIHFSDPRCFTLENEDHQKRLTDSLYANYPQHFEGIDRDEITFIECFGIRDAADDMSLRSHIGTHWKDMKMTVEFNDFKHPGLFPAASRVVNRAVFGKTKKPHTVLVCKSGRHRTLCMKRCIGWIAERHGMRVKYIDTSKGRHWSSGGRCGGTHCSECNEGNENAIAETHKALVAARKIWHNAENQAGGPGIITTFRKLTNPRDKMYERVTTTCKADVVVVRANDYRLKENKRLPEEMRDRGSEPPGVVKVDLERSPSSSSAAAPSKAQPPPKPRRAVPLSEHNPLPLALPRLPGTKSRGSNRASSAPADGRRKDKEDKEEGTRAASAGVILKAKG